MTSVDSGFLVGGFENMDEIRHILATADRNDHRGVGEQRLLLPEDVLVYVNAANAQTILQ